MKNQLAAGEFVAGVSVPLPTPAQQLARLQDQQALRLRHLGAVCRPGDRARRRRGAAARASPSAAWRRSSSAPAAPRPPSSASRGPRPRSRPRCSALDGDFTPLSDLRASADYRRQVARGLLQAAVAGNAARTQPLAQASVWATRYGQRLRREARSHEPDHRRPLRHDASRTAPPPRVVGRDHAHESAHLHVAGSATYIDDLPELAGTLHAALGLSPLAHGRLKGIRLDALRALPGVVRRDRGRAHPRRKRVRPDRARRPDPGQRRGALPGPAGVRGDRAARAMRRGAPRRGPRSSSTSSRCRRC